ncbi:MAG: hypothetical protein JO047_07440 [Alphaproteobacteria bacterium]|nr:hypothetical protein [Alphaproteobacteria bacterium]
MSDEPDTDADDAGQGPGTAIVRSDRANGKQRRGQGRGGRKLLAMSAAQRLQPAPAGPLELPPPPPAPAAPPPSVPGAAAAQYSQVLLQLQRTRKRRYLLRLALYVGLPTLLVFLYTWLMATPRYVVEFEVTYQAYQPTKSLSSGLVDSIFGSNNSGIVDTETLIYEYIQSPALLNKLDSTLNLRKYYSKPGIDWFSRLSPNASSEKFLSYYRRHVSVSEGLGGYLTVDVTAFDPKFALTLAKAVVQACDEMIDSISARARQDQVRAAEEELARQEDRVRKARKALTDFQNRHGDLDPQRVATQLGNITGSLEAQLATARTELASTLAYMKPDAPRVVQLKYLISALEQQLKQEQSRLATSSGGTPYSQILDEYSALQLEQDFASKAYLAAQQGLTVARAEAARQETYLVDFAPPSAPDSPTIWFPITFTAGTFLITLVVFGVSSLMLSALRDQAGI